MNNSLTEQDKDLISEFSSLSDTIENSSSVKEFCTN